MNNYRRAEMRMLAAVLTLVVVIIVLALAPYIGAQSQTFDLNAGVRWLYPADVFSTSPPQNARIVWANAESTKQYTQVCFFRVNPADAFDPFNPLNDPDPTNDYFLGCQPSVPGFVDVDGGFDVIQADVNLKPYTGDRFRLEFHRTDTATGFAVIDTVYTPRLLAPVYARLVLPIVSVP